MGCSLPPLTIVENSLQTPPRALVGDRIAAPLQAPVAMDLERAAPRLGARRDPIFPLLGAINKRHRSSIIMNVALMCAISLWTVMIVEPSRSTSFAQNSKAVKAVWTIISVLGFVATILNAQAIPTYNETGREIKILFQRRLPTLTSTLGRMFGFFWVLIRLCLIIVWVLGPFFWYVSHLQYRIQQSIQLDQVPAQLTHTGLLS